MYSTNEALFAAIKNGAVQELGLADRRFDDESCRQLANVLHSDGDRVTAVDLSNNVITDAGVAHLCRSLERNNTVKELHLEGNVITDAAVEHVVRLLEANSTIIRLSLGRNEVSA